MARAASGAGITAAPNNCLAATVLAADLGAAFGAAFSAAFFSAALGAGCGPGACAKSGEAITARTHAAAIAMRMAQSSAVACRGEWRALRFRAQALDSYG